MAQANPFGAKLNVRLVKVSTLKPWDRNPRTITPKRLADLQRDLAADPEMLWVRPLVARPDGTVLMGNQRLAAAQALGWSQIPVAVVDAEDETAVLRALRDNVPYGDWSDELGKILLEMPEPSRALAGFDSTGLQRALNMARYPSLDRDDDPIPATPASPVTKAGDVIDLGRHRLVCGDATDPDVWRLLLGAAPRADACVFTSPPYGIGDQMHLRNQSFGRRKDASRVRAAPPGGAAYVSSDDDPSGWRALMDGWLPAAREHTAAQIVNVQLLAPNKRELLLWLAANVEYVADVGVWAKASAPPQMKANVLTSAYEFLIVLAGEGASRTMPFAHFHGTESNVVTAAGTMHRDDHLASMPVGLAAHVLLRWVPRARIVVDPFAGTGTTMVAVDVDPDRACYMIEIDPAYCDVIRDRWESLRGGA